MAERRRFLGTMLQRGVRLNDKLGGGSITVLGVMYHPTGAYKLPPAARQSSVADIKGFDAMPTALQDKLRAALLKKQETAATLSGHPVSEVDTSLHAQHPESRFAQPRPVVEEFMSISDGQLLVDGYGGEKGWVLNTAGSVSRIGSPGAAGPFQSLDYLQLRLDIMYAKDMNVHSSALKNRLVAIEALLQQSPREVASLAEQTVGLFAIQRGYADNKTADEVSHLIASATDRARETMAAEMEHMNANPSEMCSPEFLAKLTSLYETL
jgi:F-type H+-transporting ATPase subunit alpha